MNPNFSLSRWRAEWAPSVPRELLAGAVATFALIPEVIAFSFVAGVDPAVGLYASFIISIVIAVFGARPAMVSAAAGSVALVARRWSPRMVCNICWPQACWPAPCRSPSACARWAAWCALYPARCARVLSTRWPF
jgi:hypothetical protein